MSRTEQGAALAAKDGEIEWRQRQIEQLGRAGEERAKEIVCLELQGYLTYKKTHPCSTLQ